MEQRSIDIEFWKQKLEEKWFFNIESKTWVYVILVDFVRKALRRIGTRYDFAGLCVFCAEDCKYLRDPDFYALAQRDPDTYSNCFYSVHDFDVASETIPYGSNNYIPTEELAHWHLDPMMLSSPLVIHKKRRLNDQMYSIDDFKALIDINPYRDFQVSNWLVEQLTGSFTSNTTNDKRIIIRKEIDYSVWGLTKIYSDLKNGLGFDPKHNISIARGNKEKALDIISIDLHHFLFSADTSS
jgi:hypothetical protein